MIENLINELAKANTREKILSFKTQISELYNEIYEKICSQGCSITNYEDIKMLHKLHFPMQAYYGPYFYDKLGVPFLKEHNPPTIDILEFIVLFYSLQVINLLENGFFDKVSENSFYTSPTEIFTKSKQDLFVALWCYFQRVITIKDDTREFSVIDDKCNLIIFYLSDDEYEDVIDITYRNIVDSNYFFVIGKILGIYRLRFTKMQYVLKYQPVFVNVGYEYLCTLIRKNKMLPAMQ